MAATVVYWCPRCLERTDEPVPVCARCRLPQTGDEVVRLREIVHRLHEIAVAEHELLRERDQLVREQEQLMAVAAGTSPPTRAGSPPGRGAVPPASGDVRADVVRDVLLWVGGLLLAIAALTFAAFAWRRLDDGGRAGLLVAATLASVGTAFGLRRRLAATAEVFAALGIALFLIDWLALRRAGVGADVDLPTWWALGSGAAAAISLGLGRLFASVRLLTAISASASAFLAIGAATQSAPATSAALSIAAVGGVAGAEATRRCGWPAASTAFVVAACGAVWGAAITVYAGVADRGEASVGLALAAAFVAAGPAAGAIVLAGERQTRDALVAVSAVAILAGTAIGWWLGLDEPWLAPAVAATSSAAAAVAPASPRAVRRGAAAGSAVVLIVALGFSMEAVSVAVGGPLATTEPTWGVPADGAVEPLLQEPVARDEAAAAIVSAISLAAIAALGGRRLRTGRRAQDGAHVVDFISGGACATAVALVPLTFRATVTTATVITSLPALVAVVTLGSLARRPRHAPLGVGALAVAAVLAIPAAGWALAAEATTVLVASGALIATAGATALAPARTATRQVSAAAAGTSLVVLGIAATMSLGAAATGAGIVAVVSAAVVLGGSTSLLRTEDGQDGLGAELAALVGLAVGISMALGDEVHLAVATTLLVPAFATAGTRPDRRLYLAIGSVSAVLATWAWLHAADVGLLEAYTVPAAAGALAAGRIVRSTDRGTSSWVVYGPALLIGLGPSLALAVAGDIAVRAVLVATAAVLVAWSGGHRRLQAPLVVGVATVVVLAIDTVGPIAAELPRWLTIAVVGAILVWLGATAERRIEQLRSTRDRLTVMERDGERADPGLR